MKDDFWSVELGSGMGPLVLGSEQQQLLDTLRQHDISLDRRSIDRSGTILVPEIGCRLVFSPSPSSNQTLSRIDISDERLRFGSLSVIGKRAHEIVGIFKVPRKETLWFNLENEDGTSELFVSSRESERSRELLARGTIWITSLGLGLTLYDGLVKTVHLCEPAHSPRTGLGPWTKEQQRLSEVRELPGVVTQPTQRRPRRILSGAIHLSMIGSMALLTWWAVQLQRRWDAAIEVAATVTALAPDSPNVLPEDITVKYNDNVGVEYHRTLGYMQFPLTPKMGDVVPVRFLPESPEKALGSVGSRDVGFQTAVPYGVAILAVYSILQLVVNWYSTASHKHVR